MGCVVKRRLVKVLMAAMLGAGLTLANGRGLGSLNYAFYWN